MNKFILVDNKQELASAWKSEFAPYASAFEFHGPADIFDFKGDAIVSPANSFGFMDGGIDLLYSMNIGWHLQKNLREKIYNEFDGELLVGQGTTIETNDQRWPHMIVAPTMRVPMRLGGTPNVYLAAKAMFLQAKKNPGWTVICPGLGTGTGGVSPEVCAIKMRMAYEDFYLGNYRMPETLFDANLKHREDIV